MTKTKGNSKIGDVQSPEKAARNAAGMVEAMRRRQSTSGPVLRLRLPTGKKTPTRRRRS